MTENRHEHAIDALKGWLILAVVVSHNESVSFHIPWLRQLLFYFHVQCFFLLASLLDRKAFSWGLMRDRAVRYLIPQIVVVTIGWLAYALVCNHGTLTGASWQRLGLACAWESPASLNAATGLRMLWFLPALFSFTILRAVSLRWRQAGILMTLAALVWMVVGGTLSSSLIQSLPYGLASAVFFFGLGEIGHGMLPRLGRLDLRVGVMACVVVIMLSTLIVWFPLGSVAAAFIETYDIRKPLTWLVAVAFPGFALLSLLFLVERLPSQRIMARIGQLSLPIYLSHMFFYRAMTRFRFGHDFDDMAVVGPAFADGLVILLLTIASSVALGVLIWWSPTIRELVFPRTWREFRGACFRLSRFCSVV